MSDKSCILINSFSLGGYRSFGEKIQRFESFSKINLFIGQNNCGKSNVLRFVHDVYPKIAEGKAFFDQLDHHFPTRPMFVTGVSFPLEGNPEDLWICFDGESRIRKPERREDLPIRDLIFRVFQKKAALDGEKAVWFDLAADRRLIEHNWKQAFDILSDGEMQRLWSVLTNRQMGNREHYWYPESLSALTPSLKSFKVAMVPAIRQVGEKNSISEEFSGKGIIERLAQLQNPSVHKRADYDKFQKIVQFLRIVTDNKTASIDIPYERDTILVLMDGKTLPLESLGTGIHEVIILAAAATILQETVVCLEEPELHLNPILQKKLIKYLMCFTNNQYFISTHSPAFMDTLGAEIFHVELKDGQSIVERVTTDKKRSTVCEDLGYRPSDLLQSNCVIWVEGPSDRIYLNWWIRSRSKFSEGIHYSIIFYGGKLSFHLSGEDTQELLEDFISLRRLNRRAVILIDSDKKKSGDNINLTKKRLREEFEKGPGFAWITEGREIENYLEEAQIKEAIRETMGSATSISGFSRYENTLSVRLRNGKTKQASKVEVAKHITQNHLPDLTKLSLKKHVERLIEFIGESNPGVHV
ncbi:ATP-dependent nuclease [Nitrosospira multiformis]|uniref:ATP-dependent nuclease n=1 Tax=Nitrosospira multiformis TaxID=1231 RepID=UPI0009BD7CC6|nr:AAA family ATPase [Nitrosospira multiformis]